MLFKKQSGRGSRIRTSPTPVLRMPLPTPGSSRPLGPMRSKFDTRLGFGRHSRPVGDGPRRSSLPPPPRSPRRSKPPRSRSRSRSRRSLERSRPPRRSRDLIGHKVETTSKKRMQKHDSVHVGIARRTVTASAARPCRGPDPGPDPGPGRPAHPAGRDRHREGGLRPPLQTLRLQIGRGSTGVRNPTRSPSAAGPVALHPPARRSSSRPEAYSYARVLRPPFPSKYLC